nr:bile acid beta-glucosidase [Anaerolineae bacterium]
MTNPLTDIPQSAWTRRLDAELEYPGRPMRGSLSLVLDMLPTIIRLIRESRKLRATGREPVMDFFKSLDPGPVFGVPLGGIGGGSVTRGWQGDFNRWQMQPGVYTYGTVPVNQFSLYVRQAGQRHPRVHVLNPTRPEGAPSGWDWSLPADRTTYHALYPRAWTTYRHVPGIAVTCRQVSPILPHNYQESSTPAAVFAYTIENTTDSAATVGILFTFQNGIGSANDRTDGHTNHHFERDGIAGIELRHIHRQPKPVDEGQSLEEQHIYEDPLTFAIAARPVNGVDVTYRTRFVTNGSCMDIWSDFVADGRLENVADDRPSSDSTMIGGALCATVNIQPGETIEIPFALAWDMPIARFGEGRGWHRRYTRFYGKEGSAAPLIARDALAGYPDWEAQIAAWQEPVLSDARLPDWFKAALFNEAYYIADGGTLWTDGPPIDPPGMDTKPVDDGGEMGHFAYLEGHEYRMINTYDVHFYASFALAQLWPELELSLQRDFAKALFAEDTEIRKASGTGKKVARKVRGIIPHDLGGPTEDPWAKVNVYSFQDASRWKDLNPKFILQVYRDFVATEDIDFLAEMWDAVVLAIDHMKQYDLDEDGLIENEGFPDQTYDAWTVSGPSAYCGGLWLAALEAAGKIAELLDRPGEARAYRDLLARGKQAYEDLLWTGEYYAYDAGSSRQSNSIMADQLAGDWYARACGLPGIVPAENAISALKTVFAFNVEQFEMGEMGAVNGMRPDGRVDTTSLQSQEVWTGTTYALAAAMLQLGLEDEAFKTAQGIVDQTYKELGYWFATPEAWTFEGYHRSLSYMRPLAIWAMLWAWQRRAVEYSS